jgi:hypothetical protein
MRCGVLAWAAAGLTSPRFPPDQRTAVGCFCNCLHWLTPPPQQQSQRSQVSRTLASPTTARAAPVSGAISCYGCSSQARLLRQHLPLTPSTMCCCRRRQCRAGSSPGGSRAGGSCTGGSRAGGDASRRAACDASSMAPGGRSSSSRGSSSSSRSAHSGGCRQPAPAGVGGGAAVQAGRHR